MGGERRTNSLAVLALLFGVVLPPCGVLIGLLAMHQLHEPGAVETGEGLALAGIGVGFLLTAAVVAYVVLA